RQDADLSPCPPPHRHLLSIRCTCPSGHAWRQRWRWPTGPAVRCCWRARPASARASWCSGWRPGWAWARWSWTSLCSSRPSWLAWAEQNGVHPGILAVARAHERVLEDVPPRTWTQAGEVLAALQPRELHDEVLLRDLLGGYLPPAWVELLLAGRSGWTGQLK